MRYKFHLHEANRLCYDINVIFDLQPTDFVFQKTNPQLRQLQTVVWTNIPILRIEVDYCANVSLQLKFCKWTYPYINRLTEFKYLLEPFEIISYENKVLKISSRTFIRALKILIAFIDSSQKNQFKSLMKKEISTTILLREFFRLSTKLKNE